eukprot:Anaeramoba_flamelloidesa86825_161.p1 GENE.a86825_161~~a86825_161.p1  ORF type:complete len:313 (-),score=27.56 a86825_161:29-967(-)
MLFDLWNYIEMIFFYKQDKNGEFKIGQKDFITFAIITLILFLARKLIFAIAGIWKHKIPKTKQLKFQQCFFQACFRTFCVIVMFVSMWETPIFKRATAPYLDQEYKKPVGRQETIPLGHKFIYLLNLGYITIMFPIVYKFENGKGIVLMYLHHIVTASVVIASYVGNLWQHGIPIFFVNDIGVFLLYYGKTFNYLSKKISAQIVFVFLVLFYFLFRGVNYPFHVFTALGARHLFHTTNQKIQYWITIMTPLLVLQLMQLIWLGFISKMLYNVLFHNRFDGDARSDNENTVNKKNNKKVSEKRNIKNLSKKQK